MKMLAFGLLVLLSAPANLVAEAATTVKEADVSVQLQLAVCAKASALFRFSDNDSGRITLVQSRSGPLGPRMTEVPFKSLLLPDGNIGVRFNAPPGDYSLFIPWHSVGGASAGRAFVSTNIQLTVLPNQPRSIGATVCNDLMHYDSFRSVSGLLPVSGVAAVILTKNGFEPVSVDGAAYYANSLPSGMLTLRLFVGTDSARFCDFVLSDGAEKPAEWIYQHMKVNISSDKIREADRKGNCKL